MIIVLQKVSRASVKVGENVTGQIDKGLLLLVGIGPEDTAATLQAMAAKCVDLRIFEDEAGKMNLSLKDVGGSLLLVSQFTLYADCSKGRRPNFLNAARPEVALGLFEQFTEFCRGHVSNVQTGVFGAMMEVELVNDGPVTIVLDSKNYGV